MALPSEIRRGNAKFCSKKCVRANMPKRDVAERFWEKVDRNGPVPAHRPELGPCWLWCAQKLTSGYGRFTVSTGKQVVAHRMAYELVRGAIPDGLELDHLCKNEPCVNPSHLEPVTSRVNILRSDNPPSLNARKTHCKNGHEYTTENIIQRKGRFSGRICRTCERLRCKLKSRRQRQQKALLHSASRAKP